MIHDSDPGSTYETRLASYLRFEERELGRVGPRYWGQPDDGDADLAHEMSTHAGVRLEYGGLIHTQGKERRCDFCCWSAGARTPGQSHGTRSHPAVDGLLSSMTIPS